MAGEWTSIRLGDVCRKIGSGATPRGGSDVYLEQGPYALIRSQNVYNDGFHRDGLAYISEKHAAELDGVEVVQNDVLLNITGDPWRGRSMWRHGAGERGPERRPPRSGEGVIAHGGRRRTGLRRPATRLGLPAPLRGALVHPQYPWRDRTLDRRYPPLLNDTKKGLSRLRCNQETCLN